MTTGAETRCAHRIRSGPTLRLAARAVGWAPRAITSPLGALAACLAVACSGCTTVSATAVKNDREAGVTRNYSRSANDLYQASVLGLENLRSDPNWRDLQITERDPATGTVIAERDLDSAVIPGLGERDAIGVFVKETADGDSAVTVVRMSSDQMPGSVGTTINSARDASGLIFPAIDQALETIPEQPRSRPPVAAAAPPSAGTRTAAPPSAPASPGSGGLASRSAASSPGASTIDRVYGLLRDGGTWRPLVRELSTTGDEEIRVGKWAVLTAAGERVLLRVKSKDGSAVDAARLALELERAGFVVDVEAASGR